MVEFDLDQPLEYAIKKIQEFASEANRPLEIDQMTSEQLVEEKVCVKRQLRHFDTAFKAKYGFEVCPKLVLFYTFTINSLIFI